MSSVEYLKIGVRNLECGVDSLWRVEAKLSRAGSVREAGVEVVERRQNLPTKVSVNGNDAHEVKDA